MKFYSRVLFFGFSLLFLGNIGFSSEATEATEMGEFQEEYDNLDVPRVKMDLEQSKVLIEVDSAAEESDLPDQTVSVTEEDESPAVESSIESTVENPEPPKEDDGKLKAAKGGLAKVPAAKRPKKMDSQKAKEAAEKDESPEDEENNRNTIKYGIPSEIADLLDTLIKNDDPRFTDEIYDIFQVSKNSAIKEKIVKYFTKLEDPCLEDYAVDLLNDPYDEKKDVVKAVFAYISAVKTKAAIPAVIALVESENENYFTDAINTLGEIGDASEALFLVEYLERDDLSDAQRQALMRTCGKMHAVETWDKLVEILEDEDENTFVRMYAAESIGLMEKKESVPVLVETFGASDPNLRQYVIKGLINFPKVVEAKETIIQGIRDEHWKVRQEAIKAVKQLDLSDSMDYLIYRAKNDSEKLIKDEAYSAIAALNTGKGNNFLKDQLEDKKVGDATKKKIVEVLIKEDHFGKSEIIALAEKCLEDDKRKDLRWEIGKQLAKNKNYCTAEICEKYLSSTETTTVSLGIDMYKNFRYGSVEAKMRSIAEDKEANSSNKNRIKKLLNIEDEEEKK